MRKLIFVFIIAMSSCNQGAGAVTPTEGEIYYCAHGMRESMVSKCIEVLEWVRESDYCIFTDGDGCLNI